MNRYQEEEELYEKKQVPAWHAYTQDFGCGYCWDTKQKRNIEIYFFDKANNLRLSIYCPSCGRPLGEGN